MISKISLIVLIVFTLSLNLQSQHCIHYDKAFDAIDTLINTPSNDAFKKAVFVVESAYLERQLSYQEYNRQIELLLMLIREVMNQDSLSEPYKRNYTDFDKIQTGAAIFRVMKDSIPMHFEGSVIHHLPMNYDFEDIFGDENWTQMFVTKLLATHKGNCHSLPYLYKILANELGFEVHLALAPNHVYIKTHSQQYGWFNVELTSGTFPMDAWLMASSYVTMDAIRSGIYMKALSEKESIALCFVDLARGYEKRYPEHDGVFVARCINKTLEYFPDCIDAKLIVAELKKKQLNNKLSKYGLTDMIEAKDHKKLKTDFEAMQVAFNEILTLGYRQMPKQMYVDWLLSVEDEKEKFQNKDIKH